MTGQPTLEQIRAYLFATGWNAESHGPAGTLWVRTHSGFRQLGVPDDPDAGYSLDAVIERIALAEGRGLDDVRDSILDVDGPLNIRISAWAVYSLCDRAAGIVRNRLANAADDGWPGVWDHRAAEAMCEQAEALATALEKAAALIKAASEADPPLPRHPLWNAAAQAAAAIVQAEPAGEPDDLEALKRRLEAMRKAKELNQ